MRGYFKGTATPHLLNVAINCIVLIKTAFSQARQPSSRSSLLLHDKMAKPCPTKNPINFTLPVKLRMCPA